MLTDSTAPQSLDTPAADAMDKAGFEHRIVSAASAPPLPSPGVRSAFELAAPASASASSSAEELAQPTSGFKSWLAKKGKGSAEGRAPAGRRDLRSLKTIAVVEMLTGAHKTVDEVAQAMSLSRKQAADMLIQMTIRGVLMRSGDREGRRTYTVAGDAPAPTTPPNAPADSTRPARKPGNTRVVDPRPQASQAAPVDDTMLRCGLFNDGALHIEVPDQPPLRLNQAQARDLVAYLDKISAALAAA